MKLDDSEVLILRIDGIGDCVTDKLSLIHDKVVDDYCI